MYVGGDFSTANGVARSKLAAFSAADGSLLGWAPTADNSVKTMVLTPDGSRVIVGGMFLNLNGSPAAGLAALDATTGTLLPWAATNLIKEGGSGVRDLRSLHGRDGDLRHEMGVRLDHHDAVRHVLRRPGLRGP